jgi:SAM-dependent MidA family methyltransferase
MRPQPTPLAAILADRIQSSGPITFAEYMEACLYYPLRGYYAKADQDPRRDYFTNVDVGPLFGRLLARQFREMWQQLGRPSAFWLIECGAGTGALAKHILDFAGESFDDFYSGLHYVSVEQSEPRRAAQAGLLAVRAANGHFASSCEFPREVPCGCVFSNELLDAMPAHRVVRERAALREIYVAFGKSGFRETTGPLSTPRLSEYFAEQGIELQEGQQAEVCLAACDWIVEVGQRLGRGFVMTIDYGREARELYNERHMRGTFLAYKRHRTDEDVFDAPGDQDLTAHVNFTALDLWGRRSGLLRTTLTTQTDFLLSIAQDSNYADLQKENLTEAEQARSRLLFKTLINPEGMGETFQVLIQHKGVKLPSNAGLKLK